ncbi:uncharacterized protein STEHIDRAFT_164895 [Stereum hirsutum FP-91666 SS1]|uniref:uncharacterized protein n=1 Tax=Stereum hirsutum (strain FP-91666) TaxID=721885 RepID=UPI000440ACA0|nr:uncharacterized protein STEHIDRAFT_164895 [Stereum hirsutum FP-91666 SS1]EIM92652.1 hypothetical protein STEHIDRAFT_164895 [Stereum hirsutum FP-91666 SS1]
MAAVVFCWVDVVLVKLSEAIVTLSSRFVGDNTALQSNRKLASLERQKEEAAIIAATQLPHEWSSVHTRLASQHLSPAVQRLALHLLFASNVIVPQLSKVFHQTVCIHPHDLGESLHSYIVRLSGVNGDVGEAPRPLDIQDRDSIAMALVLLSVADLSSRRPRSPNSPLSYRPYTQNIFLQVIQDLLDDNKSIPDRDSVVPRETLDSALIILLHWGSFIPWCWSSWTDSRHTDHETVLHLTATWLYHLDSSPEATWMDGLDDALKQNPQSAGYTFMHMLRHDVDLFSDAQVSELTLNVLRKCTWAATQLLDPCLDDECISLAHGMAAGLVPLFVLTLSYTGDDVLSLRDSTLEALTFIDSTVFQIVVRSLQEETGPSLAALLDRALQALGRIVKAARLTGVLRQEHVLNIAHMLHFFTILWHKQTSTLVHPTSITSFLSRLMDFFSEYPMRHPALLTALLTCVCAYEMFRRSSGDDSDRAWGDITLFYQLALSSRSTKILSTGKRPILSSYIIATAKQLVEDPLTCAEVASEIISVLLLILTNRILADELPLALLSSPSLCRALRTLICVAGHGLKLKMLLETPDEGLSTERLILKQRLASHGKALLTTLKQQDTETPNAGKSNNQELHLSSSYLVYYRAPLVAQIVLVTEAEV